MLATDLFKVMEAGVVMLGIAMIVGVAGIAILAIMREDNGRSAIPWGARMKVERAQASLELDAIEVKRLQIDHIRNTVLEGIKDGDDSKVAATLPAIGSGHDR